MGGSFQPELYLRTGSWSAERPPFWDRGGRERRPGLRGASARPAGRRIAAGPSVPEKHKRTRRSGAEGCPPPGVATEEGATARPPPSALGIGARGAHHFGAKETAGGARSPGARVIGLRDEGSPRGSPRLINT
ncbi:hypothetical protein NDU88_007728 [Pleurodeles waltl]|uniref:Uncharacterized protein n=1 Tax=Pleurodeles waltl TaxID=8319 RepID=A0AAV7U174_PLEWA|nr:hypothetical protein NDU88_007728 [Pleurodeles waltl]